MSVELNNISEIDYSILNEFVQKNNRKPLTLVDGQYQVRAVESGRISQADLTDAKRELARRVSYKDYVAKSTKNKSGGYTWFLSCLVKAGLVFKPNASIIKVDLLTSIVDILMEIANLDVDYNLAIDNDVLFVVEDLRLLISGEFEDEEHARELLHKVLDFDNKYLNLYINKSITLSKTNRIYITDLFKKTYLYKNLAPLEILSLPITRSLNLLQYALTERIADCFKRSEATFICIDNYALYYHVNNHEVGEFMSLNFSYNGTPLNFRSSIVPPIIID